MMFDPPDYPYKELCETYDDLLNKTNATTGIPAVVDTFLNEATINDNILMQSNDSGRFFNEDSQFLEVTTNNASHPEELFVIQSENILNYEPNLLDENTVNQFLLPLQDPTRNNDKETINEGPDLLSLHSCVICHDIFTTEADLLDHTIAFHASINISNSEVNSGTLSGEVNDASTDKSISDNNSDFETDWLICQLCERVLSTALENEPKEQLCCVDLNGQCSVSTRRLHTMFVCDLCNGLFADGNALDKHRLSCCVIDENIYDQTDPNIQHPEVCFSCDTCSRQFSSTEQLKAHSQQCQKPVARANRKNRTYTAANNNKMWNCGSCNQLFVTARELYRHKRGEDGPTGAPLAVHECAHCHKVMGSVCALHTHLKMHRVTKPGYPCRLCGRRFNQSGHLAIHMRKHTGERPYPCDLCPKAFKVKVERDDHRRTHTGERPFACALCHKTFTAAARLREHQRIHTDHRPYQCEVCGASFRRPYARTVHSLIHTGEKPHECDVCGTAFRRSGDMWKHKRTLHGVS